LLERLFAKEIVTVLLIDRLDDPALGRSEAIQNWLCLFFTAGKTSQVNLEVLLLALLSFLEKAFDGGRLFSINMSIDGSDICRIRVNHFVYSCPIKSLFSFHLKRLLLNFVNLNSWQEGVQD